MKIMRKIIRIDEDLCDGCGVCVPSCAEGAIEVVNGKAKVISEKYCDGLGACLGECPKGALTIVEREADDYDEDAVETHLKNRENARPQTCPSAQPQTLKTLSSCEEANVPTVQPDAVSALSTWPVQIRLVPPTAPFLKGADLLVVADCTPVAYPRFHNDFIKGKVVLVGCPKFDDAGAYVEKMTKIFRTADIKSITSVIMEVPCCSGLPMILKKAMAAAGKAIPIREVVISTRGEILSQKEAA
jgi:Pyruvate/2-oxoacid:ferredoxin oxidoreductase delta subunit